MKKRKYLVSCLAVLVLISCFVPRMVSAHSGEEIKEILILGPTRSNHELVRNQLPFAEGDLWKEEYRELTYQRLNALQVFDPMALKIITEPLPDGGIRVIVRASDTSIYSIDPMEFIIMKGIGLNSSQLTQHFRNPLGNGLNIQAGLNWSSNPWWYIGTQYVGLKGPIISWNHLVFTRTQPANEDFFKEKGIQESLSLRYIKSPSLHLKGMIRYRQNEYKLNDQPTLDQEYLICGSEILYLKVGELKLSYSYGYSLIDSGLNFQKGIIEYLWKKELKKDRKLISHTRMGITSPDTPVNYLFQGGGYSSIPLRGHSFGLTGKQYLSTNIEYHKKILDQGLWGIFFVDTAQFVDRNGEYIFENIPLDIGAGLAFDTPLGLPVRLDGGYDLRDGNYNWQFGFGHSY